MVTEYCVTWTPLATHEFVAVCLVAMGHEPEEPVVEPGAPVVAAAAEEEVTTEDEVVATVAAEVDATVDATVAAEVDATVAAEDVAAAEVEVDDDEQFPNVTDVGVGVAMASMASLSWLIARVPSPLGVTRPSTVVASPGRPMKAQ